MHKPIPRKRKSIHDQMPLNEIKDNIKNDAIVTRSKTQEKAQKQAVEDGSDENSWSADSSDQELEKEVASRRRRKSGSISEELETYRLRNRKTRSASSSNEVDSSPPALHRSSPTVEPKSFTIDNYDSKRTVYNNYHDSSRKSQPKKKVKSEGSQRPVYESERNSDLLKSNDSGCNCFLVLGICLLLFSTLAVYLYYYKGNEYDLDAHTLTCGKDDLECITDNVKTKLKNMRNKYTHQDKDLWKDVYMGIRNIIHEPTKPSIILLLANKSDTVSCLAALLGDVSSNALNSDVLKLTPDQFQKDMGSVITSLRSKIKNKKAVIIWDLLSINEEALKAFHNLCDRINPLVEEVIYIITVIADDYDNKNNPLEFVEKKLYNKLSGKIKEDAIQPLITRITDGPILTVNPEPDMIECPLSRVSD